MFVRRDVTKAPLSSKEVRGVNEKEWIIDTYEDDDGKIQGTGREALFKLTQIKSDTGDSTYADYGEVILSDICNILGVPCAQTELVTRNGAQGVLSFQFLDKENGDELIDIGSVIQNTGRMFFDSKRMMDMKTKEAYSIEMILEGLESVSSNRTEFSVLKTEFLQQVLVDSLTDHYDRNPSNISVVRNRNGIHVSHKYDNGTALSISVPSDALKEHLDNPSRLRENVYSKIGYLYKNYQRYPDLESFILNYHYEEVKDFIQVIRTKFTDEAIDSMFDDPKYEELPEIHKEIIKQKLKNNRDLLLERHRKVSKKHVIDKIIFNRRASDNFKKHVEKGTITEILPEYAACIGKTDLDSDYSLTLDEQVEQKIQNTVDIAQLSRYFEMNLGILTPREKNLLKWNIIIENMQKANPDKDIFGELAERCGFLRDDIELLQSLIDNKFKDGKDVIEARDIIYGENGIGENNINLYLCKKFIDASAMRKDIREQRFSEVRDLMSTMKEAVELEGISREKLKIKPRNIMALGNDEKQTVRIQLEIAQAFKANPRISYKEQMAIVERMSAMHFEQNAKKISIGSGTYVDLDLYNFINENTVTLENGKRIVFIGQNKKAKQIALKMGAHYIAQIVESPSGDGVTMSAVTASGEKFPQSIIDYIGELEKGLHKMYGEPEKGKEYFKYYISNNQAPSFFAVVSAHNPDVKIPNVTVEKMRGELINRFNNKVKEKSFTDD